MKKILYVGSAECDCIVLDEVVKLWQGKKKPDYLMESDYNEDENVIHLPDKDVRFREGDTLVFTGTDIYVE